MKSKKDTTNTKYLMTPKKITNNRYYILHGIYIHKDVLYYIYQVQFKDSKNPNLRSLEEIFNTIKLIEEY